MSYSYASTIREFKNETIEAFMRKMIDHYSEDKDEPIEGALVDSWRDCFEVTHPIICNLHPNYDSLYMFFEYELIYDTKRTDLIILGDSNIVLFEYKRYLKGQEYINPVKQLMDYYRIMSKYQPEANNYKIHPAVVYTLESNLNEVCLYEDIEYYKLSPQYIDTFIENSMADDIWQPIYLDRWL